MQITDKTRPIMVTGASGYIANWIVKILLEKGYTVHATVRDPNNEKSVAPLKKIAAAAPQGTLVLFKSDLLAPGSFDQPMQGCEVVIHTASPFVVRGFKDPHEALIRPAVEGTRNVLDAVNRTETVKRVVLTSSVAAIFGDNADLAKVPRGVFTEDDWNTTSSEKHQPYSYSKCLAEKEAWKIYNAQTRWQLVTINPGMVGGPALTRNSASTSIDTLVAMGTGRLWPGVPHMRMGWVDVRDVAQAHIEAAFRVDAEGRHILVNGEPTLLEIADILRRNFGNRYRFPFIQLPKFVVKWFGRIMDSSATPKFVEQNAGHELRFDNSRSKQRLGIQYHPLEQMFVDHFLQLIEDGLVTRK